MDFPLFLAMTAAEFANSGSFPAHIAYMGCHFSSSGSGLRGIPRWLPPDSVLMLTDEIPPKGHDPQQVIQELCNAAQQLKCRAIVFDLQRPALADNHAIVKAAAGLPCPLVVSAAYAEDIPCSVLLPPPPLWTPLATHIKPWQGRSIWLEAITEGAEVTVTEKGSTYTPCGYTPLKNSFHDPALHIDYHMQLQSDRARFHMRRSRHRMGELLEEANSLGVECAIALYQQENAPL